MIVRQYLVISEVNQNWVLADLDTFLVLQEKVDRGGKGQVWELEVVVHGETPSNSNQGTKVILTVL